MNFTGGKEESQNKRKELDHQLDTVNQKLLFKMLNYLINSRHSQSVDISNCNSANEAIDKINMRIKYLENHISTLKMQYDSFSQFSAINDPLIKSQDDILQKINFFSLEKEDLEIKILKIESENKNIYSKNERIDEKIQSSKTDIENLKQMNESTLKNLNLIQNQNELDLMSSKMIEQDVKQVNNFDMFIHFVESVIEK